MSKSLKSLALSGMIWSALDKFAVQFVQFFIGIVLARLLMPADFGLIGMLSIFIAISGTFVDSGMGDGLVQKKDRTNDDYSTVFVFNLVVSISAYIILFFTAPLIADFYNMPQLVAITRVLTLNIVINAFSSVQRARLLINVDFKAFAKVNVISSLSSGIFAVYLAYLGFGVWALVIQQLISTSVNVALISYQNKWKPSIKFSKDSFQNLFGFGSKLLITSLVAKFFQEITNLAIGKYYSASDLGYYSKAKGFAEMSSGTVTGILQRVTYPILATLRDDREKMISVYRRLIRMTSFFVFPLMTLLSLLSYQIVIILLTEKWAPVVVLLQWTALSRILYPICGINLNLLKALGRSDLFMKVDFSNIPFAIISLVITIPLGVKAIVIGQTITYFIAFFVTAYMPGKLLGFGALKQLKDMFPMFVAVGIMSIVVYFTLIFIDNLYLELISGMIIGIGTYLFVSYLLKIEELFEVKKLLFKKKA